MLCVCAPYAGSSSPRQWAALHRHHCPDFALCSAAGYMCMRCWVREREKRKGLSVEPSLRWESDDLRCFLHKWWCTSPSAHWEKSFCWMHFAIWADGGMGYLKSQWGALLLGRIYYEMLLPADWDFLKTETKRLIFHSPTFFLKNPCKFNILQKYPLLKRDTFEFQQK